MGCKNSFGKKIIYFIFIFWKFKKYISYWFYNSPHSPYPPPSIYIYLLLLIFLIITWLTMRTKARIYATKFTICGGLCGELGNPPQENLKIYFKKNLVIII